MGLLFTSKCTIEVLIDSMSFSSNKKRKAQLTNSIVLGLKEKEGKPATKIPYLPLSESERIQR